MAEPLINNSVYLKNHITERKIVEKGKLKTTNLSGDEVQETGKKSVFRAGREHVYEKQVEAGFWSRRRRHCGDPNTCIT